MEKTVIGKSLKRLEDDRFLRGQGCFVDDVQLPHLGHAALLRSPHAHARILELDLTAVRRLPGVLAAYAFEDFADLMKPIPVRLNPYGSLEPYLQYPLARDRVRYVGEPLALVVAESRYRAEDALEHALVRYEALPAAVDAQSDAPASTLHRAAPDNVASRFVVEHGDWEAAFAAAACVVRSPFDVGRHTAVPLETRGLVAHYDAARGRLRVWGPTKVTHFNRGVLARLLELPEQQIQLIEPDVGGGFGVRGEFYPEDFLIPCAALRLGRPLKWIEDRTEHLLACNHSRQQHYEMSLALKRDGTILGAKVQLTNDMGGYIRTHGIIVPELSAALFPGPYRVPHYRCEVRCVLTNKTPTGTYRAPGRFEANAARERLLDLAAQALDLDPVALRHKNLIPPQAMPYTTGTRALGEAIVYDSGDYPYALDNVIEQSDYHARRARLHARSSETTRWGLGIGCFVEKTGLGPFEGARVAVDATGQVSVSTGAASVGQGLETVLAQIVAQVLTVAPETIRVLHGDTDLIAYGVGSFASRATVMAGNAAFQAAQRVRDKVLRVGAQIEGVSQQTLTLREGCLVSDDGQISLTLAQLAQATSPRNARYAADPGLEATHYFHCERMTYAHGVAVAQVALDAETGRVSPQQVWVSYDVGRAINPQTVSGQIAGGVVQGLGGALFEELVYDETGQLLSGTLMDYLLPTVAEVPPLHQTRLDRSPSPLNPLGVKGAGECGIAGVGAALANAVADALGPAGQRVDTLPLTPERVWRWLHQQNEAGS